MIQQDKQRARLARSSANAAAASAPQQGATRLARVLGSAGLADHLAAKTLQDRAWSVAQEQRFVDWINCQIVGHATPNGQNDHSGDTAVPLSAGTKPFTHHSCWLRCVFSL